jgi:hypothetical protein
LSGMLLFGLTPAFLFAVIQKVWVPYHIEHGHPKGDADRDSIINERSPGTGGTTRSTPTRCLNCNYTRLRVVCQTPVPCTSHKSAGICER